MVAPSCAWVRVGLRRIPNAPSRNPTNTSNFERARLRIHLSNTSRRYNSTGPEGAQGAAATARTIPGPSWLWLDPIVEPFRAYGRVQQRRPYMTQLVSSLIIYFIGDCVAQSITQPEPSTQQQQQQESVDEADEKGWVQQWSDDRDWTRTMRALCIGGLSAIPSYRWFLWLSNSFNYRSKTLSLSIKVFINQAFFTPLFNSYFFGMQTLLSGGTFPEIIERIRNTVPTSWWNSCKIWPAVTAFSFTYVPMQYRSIFGGVVAIGWQTYLNLLNQQAAAVEELERAAGSHVAPLSVRSVHAHAEHGQVMQKCVA